MKALGLGRSEFFLDAPPPKMIADGFISCWRIGRGRRAGSVSPAGARAVAPADRLKIGRMILAARDHGCLREVLVIAAALSVQDPRDRPQAQAGTADQRHALFRGGEQDEKSEFLWYWNLWKAYEEVIRHQSSNKAAAVVQGALSVAAAHARMAGYPRPFAQPVRRARLERRRTVPAHYDAIHKALLTGLLGHLGCKGGRRRAGRARPAGRGYHGARGIKFWPHPGSSLSRKGGKWIVCAE